MAIFVCSSIILAQCARSHVFVLGVACHVVMVVSDRFRATTGFQTRRIHLSLATWSTGCHVTLSLHLSIAKAGRCCDGGPLILEWSKSTV